MPNRMRPNFIYLSWNQQKIDNYTEVKNDMRNTVQVTSSIGPYKNVYGNIDLEKNRSYYWEIKIIKGNYFKIGVVKASQIATLKNKAFSDIKDGFAFFSTGQLRNGEKTSVGGTNFKKAYGPGDIVGVQFNSIEGTLSFSLNDSKLEVAFNNVAFKKGGYVPAVAALIEGCKFSLTLPDLQD